MKTIVDHSRSTYTNPIINSKVYEFSKDMGFEVKLCRAYRPQTKGKVENLAKIMDRLQAFDHEFTSIDELDELVKELNIDLNNEICQSTGETPNNRFKKEKEYLNPLPSNELLNNYFTRPITRIVTKESMIVYNKLKYSLSTKYIGKEVTIVPKTDILQIYYNKILIASHKIIEGKKYNYTFEDIKEILKSDSYKHKDDETIDKIAQDMLKIYDSLGGF